MCVTLLRSSKPHQAARNVGKLPYFQSFENGSRGVAHAPQGWLRLMFDVRGSTPLLPKIVSYVLLSFVAGGVERRRSHPSHRVLPGGQAAMYQKTGGAGFSFGFSVSFPSGQSWIPVSRNLKRATQALEPLRGWTAARMLKGGLEADRLTSWVLNRP